MTNIPDQSAVWVLTLLQFIAQHEPSLVFVSLKYKKSFHVKNLWLSFFVLFCHVCQIKTTFFFLFPFSCTCIQSMVYATFFPSLSCFIKIPNKSFCLSQYLFDFFTICSQCLFSVSLSIYLHSVPNFTLFSFQFTFASSFLRCYYLVSGSSIFCCFQFFILIPPCQPLSRWYFCSEIQYVSLSRFVVAVNNAILAIKGSDCDLAMKKITFEGNKSTIKAMFFTRMTTKLMIIQVQHKFYLIFLIL